MNAAIPAASRALETLRNKPITPRQHTISDYSNGAMVGAAPQLFGLTGTTARLAIAYALIETAVNLLSDTPLGVKRVIPFRTHRVIDKWTGLAFLAAALATDGLRNRRNRRFVIGQAILGTAVYNLTDWNADTDR